MKGYQRGVLFGGGVFLSTAILALAGFTVYGQVRGYIAEGQSVFLTHKALLQLEMERAQAPLSRTVISSELLWANRPAPSKALMLEFARSGGRAIVQPDELAGAALALGNVTMQRSPATFADYLGVTEQLAYTIAAAAKQRGYRVPGYLYSPDCSFVSIIPLPTADRRLTGADTFDLIRSLTPDQRCGAPPRTDARVPQERRIHWLAPARDPISGRTMFKMVLPAFNGDRPFATFLTELAPEQLTDRLRQTPYDGEFLVLDRSGNVVLDAKATADSDATLARDVIAAGTWRRGFERLDSSRHQGVFAIADRLQGTDWILVYAFSWKTIVGALAPSLASRGVATLAALGLLWCFLLFLHRKIITPLYVRSQRVFESEDLNRSITTMAPVALGLLAIENGDVLVENAIMKRYRSSESSARRPLNRQLLDKFEAFVAAQGGDAATRPFDCELALARADGSACDLLASLVKTRYQGRDVLLCSFSDITERKQVERKLEEARVAADEANKAKSSFLAAMSHEIRTPLNAVLGHLELLGQAPLPDLELERVRSIGTSSRILLDVINDILDFSKIESGQMGLESISFDVVDLVEQIIEMFSPIADTKGLTLHYTVDPRLHRHYLGDPTRIRQIIANLVSNAIKFTERGKVTVDVRMSETNDGSPLVISVVDTGVGIAPERLHDIFDAFSQADSSISRRFGGTGLGLTLCRRMIGLMGGAIDVTSHPGQGSAFTIQLPLATSGDAQAPRNAFEGRPRLALLCASPEWRASIVPHLEQWGLDVKIGEHPDALHNETSPLLVFGTPRHWNVADEDGLARQAPWVIDAVEDGPRAPIIKQTRIVVSCYSLDALHAAIARAIGQSETEQEPQHSISPGNALQARVLVVEDNAFNRALLRDQFDALGYDVDIVEDGLAALTRFGSTRYDLIMTDLGMPKIDGYMLTSILRAQGTTVPIIAITAHAGKDERDRCAQVGISGVLLKPMSLADIDRAVREHLDPTVEAAQATFVDQRDITRGPLRSDLHAVLASECETLLASIRDALERRDLNAALDKLHSLKGSFALLHEQRALTACNRMEALGSAGRIDEMNDALASFTAVVHGTLKSRAPLATTGEAKHGVSEF
ncbi:ATP-binding protein [Burkholderia territorii]|uniref:ATP-binding protein n=1 Tax=Burkholderia territorii TaxID=1503055 RepID=UPI0018C75388|nr:ATP-binding protein [Burkholderia territorii]